MIHSPLFVSVGQTLDGVVLVCNFPVTTTNNSHRFSLNSSILGEKGNWAMQTTGQAHTLGPPVITSFPFPEGSKQTNLRGKRSNEIDQKQQNHATSDARIVG
jgi:hypothetical protein